MKKVAIIYFSKFEHTTKQAEFVAKGVNDVDGVTSTLFNVTKMDEDLNVLNNYDGMIFGSPTYMGNVAGPMKQFMDDTSKFWMAQTWKDKIAGGFTNSYALSGDKLNTLIQMMVFAMQHSMVWVGLGHMNTCKEGEQGDPTAINRMGSFAGAMAQSDNQNSGITPPQGDLDTARLLGQRIAEKVLKLT